MACYKKQRSKNAPLPIARYSFSLSNLSVTWVTVRLGSGGITENQKKLQFSWLNPCVMPLKVQFNKCVFKSVISTGTILWSQKRYHGFEPPKSHDFGGFSRVSSLFRNHEVCRYRVQKKISFQKNGFGQDLNPVVHVFKGRKCDDFAHLLPFFRIFIC